MAAKVEGIPDKDIVTLDVNAGEFIRHIVTAQGAQPTFVIRDQFDQTILTSRDLPPQATYTVDWKPPGNTIHGVNHANHVLVTSFPLAVQYIWRVEHCNKHGAVKELIKNVTVTGDPTDDCEWGVRIELG